MMNEPYTNTKKKATFEQVQQNYCTKQSKKKISGHRQGREGQQGTWWPGGRTFRRGKKNSQSDLQKG